MIEVDPRIERYLEELIEAWGFQTVCYAMVELSYRMNNVDRSEPLWT